MVDRPFSVAEFRRVWADPALTLPQIAARFGVSKSTAAARGRRLGLPPRPPGPGPVLPLEEVLRMHALGMAHREIAAFFGCHWQTVFNTLRRAGAPSRGKGKRSTMTAGEYRALVDAWSRGLDRRPPREVRDELLLAMVNANVARRDIGRVLGLNVSTVTKLAAALGAPKRRQGGERRTTLAEFTQMRLADAMAAEHRRAG